MQKKIYWGFGITLCVAALVFFLFRFGKEFSSRLPQASDNVHPASLQDLALAMPSWHPEPFAVQEYRFLYEGGIKGHQEQNYSLKGRLQLTVLDQETMPYRARLQVFLDDPPQAFAGVSPELRDEMLANLLEGTLVEASSHGINWTLPAKKTLTPTAAAFWSALVDRIRVQWPTQLDKSSYQQQEQSPLGLAEAKYDFVDWKSARKGRLSGKQLQKYLRYHGQENQELSAHSSVTLQDRGLGVARLVYDEEQSLQLGSETLQAQTYVELEALPARLISQAEQDAARESVDGTVPEPHNAQETLIQKAALAGRNIDEIWRDLASSQNDARAELELYLQLKAWVYLHPEDGAHLLELLRSLPADDPRIATSIKALVAVGHDAAQAVLVSLLEERAHDRVLTTKIVSNIAFLPQANAASQKAVEELASPGTESGLRNTANLALGIIGQRLKRSDDPEDLSRVRGIETAAWEHLQKAQTEEAEREALAVLGNLGPERWRDLSQYWGHQNPQIRGQAYLALRFVGDPEASTQLLKLYEKEAVRVARLDILQSLDIRAPDATWFQVIDKLVERRESPEVQVQIGRSLIKKIEAHPEKVTPLLDKLLAKADDQKVRTQLTQLRQVMEASRG